MGNQIPSSTNLIVLKSILMKTLSIKAQGRTDLGKKSTQALRKQDHIPCVMYGGEKPVHFHAHENDFRKMIYNNEVFLLELDVDGTQYKATLKELQFHPVTDKVLHMDFIEVNENEPAIVSLPVSVVGNSVGILAGGKLRQRRRYLKVKGLVKDMPEVLEIDITKVNIGGVIKVADLNYENLELLDVAQSMVVGIAASRLSAKGGTGEIEGEEGAESEESTEEAAPAAE